MENLILLLAILIVIGIWIGSKNNYFKKEGNQQVGSVNSEDADYKKGNDPRFEKKKVMKAKLTVVYDNNLYDKKLKTGWGFSCVVNSGDKNILFDTGADGAILLSNMELLGISPQDIDMVVLSHVHHDHTGGLFAFLERNAAVDVYFPDSFPTSFKKKAHSFGAESIEVSKEQELTEGVYSTGALGTSIKEQALFIETGAGLVIITGCAHPGIINVLEKVTAIKDRKIYLVVGGFHLGSADDAELRKIIRSFRDLGVQRVAPCHCSGDRCRNLFKKDYDENYVEVGVGKSIVID